MLNQLSSSGKSLPLRLAMALFRFQRRRRMIALQSGIAGDEIGQSVNFHEQTILLTLLTEKEVPVKDFIDLLGLEQSWVSRTVSGLVERGLIDSVSSPEDGRVKLLSIRKEGKSLIARLDKSLSRVMKVALAPLKADELKNLETALAKLADASKAFSFQPRSSAHPVDVSLSRLTLSSGILTKDVFGSGLANTQIQVLILLHEIGEQSVPISYISSRLPYDMSTISRTVSQFEREGWLEKVKSIKDKRSLQIQISKAGSKIFRKFQKSAENFFAPVVTQMEERDVVTIVTTFERLTALKPPRSPDVSKKYIHCRARELHETIPNFPYQTSDDKSYLIYMDKEKPMLAVELNSVEPNSKISRIWSLGTFESRRDFLDELDTLLR